MRHFSFIYPEQTPATEVDRVPSVYVDSDQPKHMPSLTGCSVRPAISAVRNQKELSAIC